MTETIIGILLATLGAGTPLVYAALGELVTEKSGVLNLGVEGMMIVGAVCGFAVAAESGSLWLGVGAAVLAGMGMALIFGVLTLTLPKTEESKRLSIKVD